MEKEHVLLCSFLLFPPTGITRRGGSRSSHHRPLNGSHILKKKELQNKKSLGLKYCGDTILPLFNFCLWHGIMTCTWNSILIYLSISSSYRIKYNLRIRKYSSQKPKSQSLFMPFPQSQHQLRIYPNYTLISSLSPQPHCHYPSSTTMIMAQTSAMAFWLTSLCLHSYPIQSTLHSAFR